MEDTSFDALSRILGHVPSRRALFPLLGSMLAGPTFAILPAEAKKKKKKKKATLCLDGQTIQASKKKKKKLLKSGATPGECPPPPAPCTPGSCGAGAICDGGVCHPCTITCDGDGIRCGLDLQAALDQGGAVYACPGRYIGNLAIATNVVLIGAGDSEDPATNTILDANQTGQVVDVKHTVTADIQRLRVTGGNDANAIGGGIQNSGALTITACTVTKNSAFGGGGIWHNSATNPLVLVNCIVSENQAEFNGGGIRVSSGSVTITGSTIIQNLAGGGGGGLNNEGAVTFDSASRIAGNIADGVAGGGGILNVDPGTVSLNGAVVTGNSSPQCVGVFCP